MENYNHRTHLPIKDMYYIMRVSKKLWHDLSLGVHPTVVQELLCHTQFSMTMAIYSHVLPSMQQDAVSKLNTLALVSCLRFSGG